jgi:hypothetical protein
MEREGKRDERVRRKWERGMELFFFAPYPFNAPLT